MDIKRPDIPSRCTWTPNGTNSPHTKREEQADRHHVLSNILEAIGQTPMVRLNNIPQSNGIKCEIFAKCEFMNPGGSVKDRIAYRMIQDAEEQGILKPGSTIIEPTSGNTGIGLAMAAAVKGYRCIIVMPEKMSNEKVSTLRALGAEIVRTPTEAAWNSPEGHISMSQKLQKEIPNSVILDQYTNPGNPLAHYNQTAMEIWKQCDGKLDYLIAGSGTGGTISGIGRKLKELCPNVQIVAVDPVGSILAHPPHLNDENVTYYEVEGIGYDFIPTVLDRDVVDAWIKTNDCESFIAARSLIKEEGLLVGGSSGAALAAAFKIAKDLPAEKRIVILLPDGIRNYLTKFVSDYWMECREFLEATVPPDTKKWWWNYPVSALTNNKPPTVTITATIQDALNILQNDNHDQVLVVTEEKNIEGVITTKSIMKKLSSGTANLTNSVDKVMVLQYPKVLLTTTLGKLSYIFENETYAVVVNDMKNVTLAGIVNYSDMCKFLSNAN